MLLIDRKEGALKSQAPRPRPPEDDDEGRGYN